MRQFCRCIVKILFRAEFINEANVPESGPVICCSNHTTVLDPVFIACNKHREFAFMAKEELFHIPLLGSLIRKLNAFPVKRNIGDLGAIRHGIEVLKKGNALVVFPEGTRSKTGKLQDGKDGAALLAKKTGAVIVPCATNGKPKLFRKTKLIYGTPMDMTKYADSKDLKAITADLMHEIAKLMEEL